ncbi:MAG: cell division protein CrgA [Actinomycetota bacterium]|nr:cell division protein CrgA [Actinomycetota bacterium]
MPKSRIRRRSVPAATGAPTPRRKPRSYAWVAPAMLFFFILGIAWLSVYYISAGQLPVMRDLQAWNLAVGFSFIMIGFALATQWR